MSSNIKGTTNERLVDVVKYVHVALQMAQDWGLEVEVISSAMIFLKENPDASIETALNAGLGDWGV